MALSKKGKEYIKKKKQMFFDNLSDEDFKNLDSTIKLSFYKDDDEEKEE